MELGNTALRCAISAFRFNRNSRCLKESRCVKSCGLNGSSVWNFMKVKISEGFSSFVCTKKNNHWEMGRLSLVQLCSWLFNYKVRRAVCIERCKHGSVRGLGWNALAYSTVSWMQNFGSFRLRCSIIKFFAAHFSLTSGVHIHLSYRLCKTKHCKNLLVNIKKILRCAAPLKTLCC